ncbi:hypothetical protein GTY75_09140 [Streptomyces sp. SID8381]|uniref:hypothetical protein n=1 Tax=unclassified Streptomyces TaxID=2593676 RepID=UPI00036DEA9B|nr:MULTISPECIES: hypothetical protein [unclassified Streptomyces]MYX26831.1 hypothetical protein [Streptomyces sp. SID8381]
MADTAPSPLHLFHAVAIAGNESTVPVAVRLPHHPVTGPRTLRDLHHLAGLVGGFVTTVYATDAHSARHSVRTHANTAYAALHGRHATLAKNTEERAVVFRTTSLDSTGDLDVVTVTREPACMYAGRVWTDYLRSQGYDRYVVSAPSDGAALHAARDVFLDELYASFTG